LTEAIVKDHVSLELSNGADLDIAAIKRCKPVTLAGQYFPLFDRIQPKMVVKMGPQA
jgi:hypothetical protein